MKIDCDDQSRSIEARNLSLEWKVAKDALLSEFRRGSLDHAYSCSQVDNLQFDPYCRKVVSNAPLTRPPVKRRSTRSKTAPQEADTARRRYIGAEAPACRTCSETFMKANPASKGECTRACPLGLHINWGDGSHPTPQVMCNPSVRFRREDRELL